MYWLPWLAELAKPASLAEWVLDLEEVVSLPPLAPLAPLALLPPPREGCESPIQLNEAIYHTGMVQLLKEKFCCCC